MARIVAAMSGGVDSTVAAMLLVREGHEVTGVTALLRPDDDGEAARAARAACDHLGIEHDTLDWCEAFSTEVIEPFLDAYASGDTPNPCIDCNVRIKFGRLLEWALSSGADALATGHYARVVSRDGAPWLARAADAGRDQSYFLYRLSRDQLEHVAFPLGGAQKADVRRIAAAEDLAAAEFPESRDACFLPADVSSFVAGARPAAGRPGPLVDAVGAVVGEHRGIAGYTVGQRRGLGGGAQEPRYVLSVRAEENVIVVGGSDALEVSTVTAGAAVWRGAATESGLTCRTRYRGADTPCDASFADGTLVVSLGRPVPGAAPGQAVVCYDGDLVMGGGVIREAM